ncbi:RNA polymerase sigma factor [Fimbriimonas ginsengisoli]|uniref:RNA polymerase sigma factor n=1 Tax=Fimbriimonas ginsengisoli TaxID=1005039 RepID=UPI001D0E71B2|nr:sigma-70 family RNA polymerase sigma factor [Fimbriimonas ginsengisoli]
MLDLFVRRAQNGDRSAVDVLIRQHRERLFRFAIGLCRDSDEAADVVAETFLRVYRSLHTFKGDSEWSTWLFRIAANAFFDYRKRNSRRERFSLSEREFLAESDSAVAHVSLSPHEVAVRRDEEARIGRAVSQLPSPHREMVQMYYFEESSYDEMAERLEIPIGTVKSRMNRARRHLAPLLLSEPTFSLG